LKVELAEKAVQSIIDSEMRPKIAENMELPSEAVGYIIGRLGFVKIVLRLALPDSGKGGSSIRSINDRCQVSIRITQDGGECVVAVIRGSVQGIRMAKVVRLDYDNLLFFAGSADQTTEFVLRQVLDALAEQQRRDQQQRGPRRPIAISGSSPRSLPPSYGEAERGGGGRIVG
jgi:hypothetical protein